MLLVLVSASACGESDTDALFPQVSDRGQIITIESLLSTAYKESKEHPVTGLPGATYVSYGFLRVPNGESYEYEVRFYDSHRQAVDLGTALALEGSGETAILNADDATYKEGVKNRRMAKGSGFGGGARSGIGARFESYAIFGNIVMLCQGADQAQAVERCGLLAGELGNDD